MLPPFLLGEVPDWWLELSRYLWYFIVFMGGFVRKILGLTGLQVSETYTGLIGFLVTVVIVIVFLKATENLLKYILALVFIIIALNVFSVFL